MPQKYRVGLTGFRIGRIGRLDFGNRSRPPNRRTDMKRLAPVGAVILTAACTSATVQCAPCPPPWVRVDIIADATWDPEWTGATVCVRHECVGVRFQPSRPPIHQLPGACLSNQPTLAKCEALPSDIAVTFADKEPITFNGASITVTLGGLQRPAVRRTGRMRYTPPESGPCACPERADAEVRV